jgi:hypothetical protein
MRFDIFRPKPDQLVDLAAGVLAKVEGIFAFFDHVAAAGAKVRRLPAKMWLLVGLAFIGASLFTAYHAERPASESLPGKPLIMETTPDPARRAAPGEAR